MSFVEYPLCRLQLSMSEFIDPSATPWEVDTLQAQIELRQRALTDIEVIRRRLRLFMSCEKPKLPSPRSAKRRVSRSRLVSSRRARVPVRQPIRLVSTV
jgi:hypothetical protein